MMEPVSVCQKVSWNGIPIAFSLQITASALSGSPTEARWRSEERSCCFTAASPSRMSERMAVGAEYHTVTLLSWMKRYQRAAVNPESSTHWVMPSTHGPMMP